MKARNREEFKEAWNEHIGNLVLLVNSVKDVDKLKTLEQIKTIQDELKKIVERAVIDTYGYQ